jgi:coproporphyrinogen III oxidase
MNKKQNQAKEWFLQLRNKLTTALEGIDKNNHNFKYKELDIEVLYVTDVE